jgi:hypothetical protein
MIKVLWSRHVTSFSKKAECPLTQTTSSRFSLAILAAAPLGPSHYPLVEWSTNISRRDNPLTDFLFEFIPVEKPTQNNPRSDTTTGTT